MRFPDPFEDAPLSVAEGARRALAFSLLFYGLLYLLPTWPGAPRADHDLYFSIGEIYRRQWLVHGHPLESSWLFGAGTLFQGIAQIPGWAPQVLLGIPLGAKAGALLWTWIQLGLGGGFAYGLLRSWGRTHRGAAIGGLLSWCSIWLLQHVVWGHTIWASLAWCLGLGWLLSAAPRIEAPAPGAQPGLRSAPLLVSLAGAALLLFASSPLQAPFYGAPLVLLAWARAMRGAPWSERLRVTGLGLLALAPALVLHAELLLATREAMSLYDREALIRLQSIKFVGEGGAPVAALRTLAGVAIPFAGFAWYSEGNLLALAPAFLATRALPGRGRAALMGGLLLLAMLPGIGPVRQLDRWLWVFVLLAGDHLAIHERRITERPLRFALVVTASIGAALSAMWMMLGLSAPAGPAPAAGINGVASPTEEHLLSEDYDGGHYANLRAGLILPRPYSNLVIEPPPVRSERFVIALDRDDWQVLADEGRLEVRGTIERGDGLTVALRYTPEVLERLTLPPGVSVWEDRGMVRLVATEPATVWVVEGR